jgi:NitT/TauT family transport system ATP-binding protein
VFLSDCVVVMSARPGRIGATIPIALPRPRTLDVLGTSEFGRYTSEIRALLASWGVLRAR